MKNFFKLFGIIAMVAVIMFSSLSLTSCDELTKTQITVTNASQNTITAGVYESGSSELTWYTAKVRDTVPPGGSITFSLNSGDYSVWADTTRYPQSGFRNMSGNVRLTYNGTTLTR